jgi:hypothetical protein
VILDAIPLLPNGKIDRKSLPSPTARTVARHVPPAAPAATATAVSRPVAPAAVVAPVASSLPAAAVAPDRPLHADTRVAYLMGVWSEMLGTDAGADDNFFDLGGHSMLAVQMANRVARETGVRLRLLSLATQTLSQAASGLPEMAAPTTTPAAPASGGLRRYLRRLIGKTDANA